MSLGGVAIAVLPSIICLKLTFSDGLEGGGGAVTLSLCQCSVATFVSL